MNTLFFIGLGNPGPKYEHTRHNVGRTILENIAKEGGFSSFTKIGKHNALVANGMVGERDIAFVLPLTYMNRSGESARTLVQTKSEAKSLCVIYDDIDLPFGEVKVSVGRGDGGHNGVKSIINMLDTKEFIRIRIGVCPKTFFTKKVKKPNDVASFVLKNFKRKEQEDLVAITEKIYSIIETLATDGIEKTMNQFN